MDFESFVFREQLFFGKIGERRKALSLSIFNSLFQSKSFPQSNAITGNSIALGAVCCLRENYYRQDRKFFVRINFWLEFRQIELSVGYVRFL
jgi:hypothetical protein